MLRDYQQRAIDKLYGWFESGGQGNPCLNLPTGSGKSHIVAALCKNALHQWPSTKILMLTHVKELVAQNAEKMRQHWPNAPLGVYSAGMGKRDIDSITFASVQSVRNKAFAIGHRDLILVDECHLINTKQQGSYRQLIAELSDINPHLRVIGLTATPHRLGQGLITQGDDALFSDIIEPVTIKELVDRGFLSPLKSKHTETQLDLSAVKKRGGEFISGQLEKAVDQDDTTRAVVNEVILRAADRKHWLFFCSGVNHAEHCADELNRKGITTACVTGKTPKAERERLIHDYKAGAIQCLTNADVLTTGFDAPDTDLLVMLRPTMSPALYIQIAGRGMRIKSHTDHCLVLDFAGNVERHGPITGVQPPKMRGDGNGEAPVKVCPDCDELVHLSVMVCPECGHEWEEKEKSYNLSQADIMGFEPDTMMITKWVWTKHVSKKTGIEMVKVRYYGNLSDPIVTEYHCVLHEGFAGQKARLNISKIVSQSGMDLNDMPRSEMSELADFMNKGRPPSFIEFFRRGKFYEITGRSWINEQDNNNDKAALA